MSHRIIIDEDAPLITGEEFEELQTKAHALACMDCVEKVSVELAHHDDEHE